MFNADGSESEMCGNGIRCVCKLAHDCGISTANPMKIQTGAGVLELAYTLDRTGKVAEVTVDMGEPRWRADEVPFDEDAIDDLTAIVQDELQDELVGHRKVMKGTVGSTAVFEAVSSSLHCQCVSMGNPHIVFFVKDVQRIPLERIGPMIEHHRAFPRRVNAHVVQVHSRHEVTMRTWERGSGITLACGTGAAAVCVAGVREGFTDREILAHLPGGDLKLRWDEKTNHVFKTGPATEVCTGEWLL
jgi:diaminopimelate epimerase